MKLCICLSSKWSHLRLTWSPFLKPWADNSSTNQYSYQLFYSWGMTHLAPSYLKNAYYGRGAWWNSLRSLLPDSVQFSRSVVSNSLRPHELQHARPPCPSPTPRVHPNPCPSSPWYHPTTSSSVVPFSSCPQSFPASGSYLINSFLTDIKQLAKTSKGGTLYPAFDVYVRSFLCPFLYFNKTLLHKSSWVIKTGPWSPN